MHIVTPTEIEHVAWEGRLEPLGEVFRSAESLPRVTLGEPATWPAEAAMESETGRAWTPPASLVARRYTLVRLSCTLHPLSDHRSRYAEADLAAYLRPKRAGSGKVVAHDLFPRQETVEETGTFKLGLGPELKFINLVDVRLLEVGAEIEYPQVHPVIQGYGLGENCPYWRFIHHSGRPLAGCQSVYAVLAAPAAADGIRLTVELIATVETKFGPVRLGLPEEAKAHVSRVIAGQPGD